MIRQVAGVILTGACILGIGLSSVYGWDGSLADYATMPPAKRVAVNASTADPGVKFRIWGLGFKVRGLGGVEWGGEGLRA